MCVCSLACSVPVGEVQLLFCRCLMMLVTILRTTAPDCLVAQPTGELKLLRHLHCDVLSAVVGGEIGDLTRALVSTRSFIGAHWCSWVIIHTIRGVLSLWSIGE